jgi:hypothetical protein
MVASYPASIVVSGENGSAALRASLMVLPFARASEMAGVNSYRVANVHDHTHRSIVPMPAR